MILSPLCLTVSRVIGAFHSNRLEKSRSKAKVYIFCVNNHLPAVWLLSQSCLLLMVCGQLAGLGSVRLPHILVSGSSLLLVSKHCSKMLQPLGLYSKLGFDEKKVGDNERGRESLLSGKSSRGIPYGDQYITSINALLVRIRKKYLSVFFLPSALIVKKGFWTLMGVKYEDMLGLSQSFLILHCGSEI